MVNLRRWQDGDAELLVNQQTQNAKLSGTALVEFDGTLPELGFFVEAVPAEIDEVIAEVTNELSSCDVFEDGKLKETNEQDNLCQTSRRNGCQRGESVGNGLEAGSVEVDVAR